MFQRTLENLVYLGCIGPQELLFATPQVITFEEHIMLITSLSALKDAIQKLESEIEDKDRCSAPLFNYLDSIRVKEIHDGELGIDLLLLLVPRTVAKELNLPWTPVKLYREAGVEVVKGVFEEGKLKQLKPVHEDGDEEENAIAGYTKQLSKGTKLFVIGGKFLERNGEGKNYIAVVKRCSVLGGSSPVLQVAPVIGSGGKVHTEGRVSDFTFRVDVPFNFTLAGAPVLTHEGALTGFLTGVSSEDGYMQLLTLNAFYEIVEKITSYDGTFTEALDHPVFSKYREITDGVGPVSNASESVEEAEDPLQGIDDFVISFEEEEKSSEKESPSPQVLNRSSENGRVIEETEDFVYIGGLTEGDILEIAKDSVVPVYVVVEDKAVGNGTGFIYKQKIYKREDRSELFFLTNIHVVQPLLSISAEGKPAQIVIRLGDDYIRVTKVIAPRGALLYLGKDLRYTPYDFCVLIVEVDTDKEFRFFHIRKELNVKETDKVIAVGYPTHIATAVELSYSEGIISHIYDDSNPNPYLKNVLQITAPINPGNSGGPLITPSLQVVGINTRGFSAMPGGEIIQNMNMAIRMDHVVNTLSDKKQLELIRLERLSELLSGRVNHG